MRVPWILALPGLAIFAACSGDDATSIVDAPTPIVTITSTPTIYVSPTVTSTETPTPTITRTITSTPTVTRTPTITPTIGLGANISFIGVLRADNTLLDPVSSDEQGRPIFERPVGSGFVLVIEAREGTARFRPGDSTFAYDPGDPNLLPDLQVESNRNLGDGSAAVCDNTAEMFGGVPGIDPDRTELTPEVSAALNDFGCRFVDGAGVPQGRRSDESCVLFPDAEYHFVVPSSRVQFCATIVRKMRFPAGDTIITARVRDINDVLGPARQIVLRVAEADGDGAP